MDYDEIDDNDMSEAGVHGSSSKKPDNKWKKYASYKLGFSNKPHTLAKSLKPPERECG